MAAVQRRRNGVGTGGSGAAPAPWRDVPAGLLTPPEHAHLSALLHHPLVQAALLALCVLSLFHWAQRFRYTLFDGLRLTRLRTPINLCYGGAAAGSVWAAIVLLD